MKLYRASDVATYPPLFFSLSILLRSLLFPPRFLRPFFLFIGSSSSSYYYYFHYFLMILRQIINWTAGVDEREKNRPRVGRWTTSFYSTKPLPFLWVRRREYPYKPRLTHSFRTAQFRLTPLSPLPSSLCLSFFRPKFTERLQRSLV